MDMVELFGEPGTSRKKTILKLNLDETAVKFYYQGRKGLVWTGQRTKRRCQPPKQKASKGQLKKAVTHVAIVCDNTEIQPKLPQMVLGSEFTFQARKMNDLKSKVGSNVHLLRLKSAWVNTKVFVDIVDRLGKMLQPFLHKWQPVLLLDAHRVHCSPQVLNALAKYHIWPVIVPASTTWLLQPLDTHAFARYKQFLRSRYTALLSQSAGRQLDVGAVVTAVSECCRQVLQGTRWEDAFLGNGFGQQQGQVRSVVLQSLEIGEPVVEKVVLPTLKQLCSCFPANHDFCVTSLFKDFLPPPVRAPRAAVSIVEENSVPDSEGWSGRLRPRRSLSQVTSADTLAPPFESVPLSPFVVSGPPECPPTAGSSSPPPVATCVPAVIRVKRLPKAPRRSP